MSWCGGKGREGLVDLSKLSPVYFFSLEFAWPEMLRSSDKAGRLITREFVLGSVQRIKQSYDF